MTGIDLDFRPIFSGRCLDAHLVRSYAAIDLFSRLISVNGAGLTEIDLDFRSIFDERVPGCSFGGSVCCNRSIFHEF